jgi:amino acid adenylation domain-containing protein
MVILFTSGSTGVPKAVELEQHSIANFCHWYAKDFELTADDRVSAYANFGFDAHMMDIYPAIFAGATVYILPDEMRKDLQLVNEYMEEMGITVSFFTTQVGCLIKDMNKSLRLMSVGGEKLPLTTAPAYRFVNGYGPTECSIYSATCDVEGTADGTYIGRPLANYQLYVIDKNCQLVPRGAAGELLICGEGVARGYMNRPELTAEKFITFKPAEDSEPVRAYRSGDLVRWAENDNIQYLGRIDKQVKLRGLRIELGEIENRAASFAGIKQVAVDVKNDQLCCYYVAEKEINKADLKAHLAETLTEFMVPEVYMQLDVMPLNANGKVDRKALPEPEVELDEIIPPATELEEKLFALVSEIIKTDKFGVTNNLVSVGLSSLGAMRLSAAISSKMSVQIKVAEIMKSPVIRDLANFISNDGNAQAEAIKHTEDREFYPITENQRGVYIDWEMNRDTTQYNIPAVYKFTDKNPEKLAEAVESAINTHSTLKTRFVFVNNDVMQQPHTDEPAEVLLANLENEPAVEFFQNRVKPFDLLNDRLYRAEIYSYGENTYLFLDVHHTLYDGLSTAVLTQDILKAYSGAELKAEEINEYDFAVYESELAGTEIYTKAELYYKNLAEDANAVKYTASQKPDNITNNTVEISVEAKQINDVCARNGITVSSYFNAAFAETLQRISREENPMYLTISNGREADARLVDCVGMFVKTLPVVLRTENHKKETVAEFLNNFHSQLQNSIENDFYPYTKIVEKYGLKGEILFAYQGGVLEGVSIENVETIPLKLDTVKLPVKVTVFPEDNNYKIVVEYNGMLYSQHDMHVLAEAIKNVAVSITTAENVSDIEMVSEEEKAEIISRSCGEYVEYDSSKTWLSMFAMQVKNQPERLAVADGNSSYTYGELDEISNKVAAYLINKGVAVNDFVAVKMNRAKEYAAAVIGIQKAGAAFVPVDMSYPAERIEYMLADSNAKISLTEEDIKSIAAENTVAEPIDKSKPENRAYMIYTSGSTGRPKGVVLHQRGLMNFTKGIMSIFELTNEDRISSHRSFSFDAHIGDFYPTLSAGASVHIMPDEIRKDLDQIYNFLMEHEITGGGYTTSIAKLLLTNYDLKQRFISCGGEALRDVKSDTVQIFNLYGPTECTNDIVVGKLEKGRYYESAPVGAPMINSYCFIVDSHGKLVPQGVRGEICYAGPQTGYGYWNLDDKTKEVFEDCPFVNGLRMYHTGDVGYYNAEGQIEYVGRIDFQVKLNGFRIELGEIEGKALQFAGVRQVSAQVRKSQICLYYSTDKEVDKDELNEFLSTALASYMVPTIYMPLEVMPLTPNGKVDRKALPDPEITLGEIVAPVNELEEKLLAIAKKFVNTDEFGVTNNLISLGLSSLAAMRLVASINNELDVQIRVADVMKKPVLRDIAEKISTGNNQEIGIKHYEEREYYPLTENQRGIYIDWEMNRETTQYNIPAVYKFNNKDSEKLAEAVKIAFNAHSYLKNSFVQLADDIMQKPNAEAPVEVLVADLKHEPNKEFFQSRIKPFDLLHDKLYRIELYKYNDSVYLFMDIHHTVIDGMSAAVLMTDILAAYNGESVEAEKITAYDVALYEQELLLADDFIKTEEYFNTLAAGAEVVSYPASLKADGVKNGSVSLTVPAKDINASASRNGITVNSYFQTALSEVLIRFSRLEKPMYLTISNGRSAGNQLDRTTGMFVKTLPVTVIADKEHNSIKTEDFLKSVHEQLQKTYELDYYPYTKFVEKHNLHGEIMFAYQGGMGKNSDEFENIDISLDTAKLPILISVFPDDDEYIIHAEYDGIRYNKADINTLLNAIANASISMSKAEKISDIKLINSEEENILINLGCGPVLERDQSETIISIFKNRVAESPNKVAVVFKDKSYTYAELDRISDNLAVYLKKNYDIKAEENVGVLINRSELMLIYPLAIMKNGAAYMPLDPHFPTDRLKFMCDDASVKVILSEGSLLEEKLPDFAGAGFNSSELNNIPEVSGDETGILTAPKANDRMVILFTSGSTGVPKAVELEQHSIANFCHWYAKDFELTADDRVSAYANFGFDAHMMDIYPAIFAGATVYILPDEMRKDLQLVNEYMEEMGITVSFFTTQVGCLIKDMNKSLRLMSVGGEKLPLTTAPAYRFVNGYGPTECSIYSATCDVEGTADGTYIGRPLANYQLYVIDKNCQLVPRGAAGELLICGEGVARGYMNRPELTAEKFITFKPAEDSEPVRAYRSGDLVRWAENDNIQYLGRIDKQVKLRGLRIELGEIENRAASFAGIKQVAVDVKNDQLCCYYVAEKEINKADLKAHLAETLTEFMVPEVYVQLDVMPLNANGKVDRKALPEPEVELEEIVSPATELEEKIFAVVAEALNNDNFGVTNNLISLGMTSLAAMRLSVAINAKLGLKVKVSEIMKKPTVRDIAGLFEKPLTDNKADSKGLEDVYRLLRSYKKGELPVTDILEQMCQMFPNYAGDSEESDEGIKHIEDREYYPITENQRGIYIDWEMNRETTQYNVPSVYKFTDKSIHQLAEAIKTAVNNHSYLKTRFVQHGEDIMQQPHMEEAVEILINTDCTNLNEKFFQSRIKPFDLFNDKLYRFELYQEENTVYLFMDIHHIIFDGLSTMVILDDIAKAYAGEKLETETISAYDVAVYEQDLINSELYAKAEARYDNLLTGANVLSYPESNKADGAGSVSIEACISAEAMNKFCTKNGLTANSYLQTVFAHVMHLFTRVENPVYLTISNGRSASLEVNKAVGMFVKTIPVVLKTENIKLGDIKVTDFVASMQEQLQESYEMEFYPYTRIVQRHKLHAEMMFVCQSGMEANGNIDNIKLSLDTVKLPIEVVVYPSDKGYKIHIDYDGRRYNHKEMQNFVTAFVNVAETMPLAETVKEISLLDKNNLETVKKLSMGKVLPYDNTETWLDMLQSFVKENPSAIALVDSAGSYNYGELEALSNKLATYLVESDVKENDFVAIKMGRVKEFMAAVVGIQKAGAAYVPVDPDYPAERVEYMLSNSEAKFVLDETSLAEILAKDFETKLINKAKPENLAYMIYTSGSTGKPKGVMQSHRSLRAYVNWRVKELNITSKSRHAQHASFSFDASLDDLISPLAVGAQVHIFDDVIRKDMEGMCKYIKDNGITGLTMPTQLGMTLLNQYPDMPLQFFMMGGEKMLPFTKTDIAVFNGYGPTEFTVCSSFHKVNQENDTDIPIGRPVPNTYSFICDRMGNLLPQGMTGELCLCGPQLSNGYWKLPEKTAEVFVECPFLSGQKMYRTGDLARYNENGELEYLGRIDFQVKLRGFRIELGEIENRAAAFTGIKQVSAQVKKDQLVLYYTAEIDINKNILKEFMAETLTEYMVPSVYMQLEKMPMTPVGKIDRKALPEPEFTSSAEYVAPETEAEIALAESMQKILGITNKIGVLDNFFELGGDSIKAIRIVSLLRQRGIILQVADIMKHKVVKTIATAAKSSNAVIQISQEPFEGKVKDSAIVKFFKHLSLPEEHHFNQGRMFKLTGHADVALLQKALDAVTRHHDILRAVVKDDSLYVRNADTSIKIMEYDVTNKCEADRKKGV